MRKLMEYNEPFECSFFTLSGTSFQDEHKLDVLISQLELTYNKIILYQMCDICKEPILITDFRNFGEQCNCCKKWFCTQRHLGHKHYFDSCSHKNLLGCFLSKRYDESYDENDVDLICLSCVIDHINKTKNHIVCEHLTKSIDEKKLQCNTIIIKNNNFYCEECDAIDNIVIYI